MMMYLFCDYLTVMYLPMNQKTKHWFVQYAWEVLQHSPHVVPLTKYFAARLIDFPHTLEMDYCVKGSDVLNSQRDEYLNRGHMLKRCVHVLHICALINCVCSTRFLPYFQNILCTVHISSTLNRRYGFSDSRSCRPRINTLMNLRVFLTSLFSTLLFLLWTKQGLHVTPVL